MAELTRRKWSDIDTEVNRLLGSPDNSNIATRRQHWIADCYFQICVTWFHHELVLDDYSQTLKAGEAEVAVPARSYIVFGVAILNSSRQVVGWLTMRDPRSVEGVFTTSDGQPRSVSRLGGRLLFDKEADEDYGLRIMSYRTPLPPDFASDEEFPETARVWDDVIILMSAAKGNKRLWSPHIGAQQDAEAGAIVAAIPQPLLAVDGIVDQPEKELAQAPLGGLRG
jgi:hypothetical protein